MVRSSLLWRKRLLAAAAMTLSASICIPVGESQEDDSPAPPEITFEEDETPRLGASEEELQKWLTKRIDRVISVHRVLANARIGVLVRDLSTDSVLYSRNHTETFNVASNTKIVTAVAALALLGPDFRFRISVAAEKVDPDGTIPGDLYIRSKADPTLTTWDLHELAEELSVTGITQVKGSIVVDNTYFDKVSLPPHFDEQPDEQSGFRAPVGATSLNFNTVSILVTPNPSGAGPAKIIVEPPNSYVRVTGTVSTVGTGRTRIRVESKPKKRSLEVKIRGQIRQEVRKKPYRLRVANPEEYLASTLFSLLSRRGIKVRKKRFRSGKTPDGAQVLATRSSPPLAEIVRALGKYSNNYVAEMLLKTIGAESLGAVDRPATWNDGLTAVRKYLDGPLRLSGDYYYGNGSGLFESNRFSPTQMVHILASAYRDFRIGPDLVSSLSIGGVDGTLRRRITNASAKGLVRAKTGTLDHVSALAGFVALDGRAPVAFAVFVNDVPKWRTGDARSIQDAVATSIAQYLRRGQ